MGKWKVSPKSVAAITGGAAAAVAVIAASVLISGSQERSSAEASASAATPAESDLASYLGFGHYPDAEDRAFEIDASRRELFIADCMQAKGFEYEPAPGSLTVGPNTSARQERKIIEWTNNNPNERARSSLRRSEREDYDTALDGVGASSGEGLSDAALEHYDDNDDGVLTGRENWDRGCRGAASREVPGVFQAAKILDDDYAEMERQLGNSPSAQEAETAWMTCMRSAGFDGSGRAELMADAETDLRDAKLGPATRSTIDMCESEFENDVALARVEFENKFVEQHKDVLERYGVRR